jgi:hypothetical protein
MKKLLLAALLAVVAPSDASDLDVKLVPANAKWVLHLDAEAFRKSKLGAMMVNDVLEPKVEQAEKDLKSNLNFSFKKISSLTAYGARIGEGADREGALIMRTTTDIKPDLEKLVALNAVSGAEDGVSKLTANGVDLYKLGVDLFATQARSNLWVLSKSKSVLELAREVASGKAPGGLPGKMTAYPASTNSFFFLALAETASEGLPAQAALFKKAEGARIVLGERGERLFLELALKSSNAEIRTQLQKAIEGLIAFVSLAKADDKDLVSLAGSAAVDSDDKFVSVSLTFPVQRAIQKVREKNAE